MPRRRAGRRSPQHWSSGRAARSNRKSAWCSSTRAPGGCTAAKPLIFRRVDRMRIPILDPTAGISGDMTLGALLSAGAPAAWLEELPRRLDLPKVRVTVREVKRSGVVFFFQAEDGIRDRDVTGVQTCALPICSGPAQTDRTQSQAESAARTLWWTDRGVSSDLRPGVFRSFCARP